MPFYNEGKKHFHKKPPEFSVENIAGFLGYFTRRRIVNDWDDDYYSEN